MTSQLKDEINLNDNFIPEVKLRNDDEFMPEVPRLSQVEKQVILSFPKISTGFYNPTEIY